MEINFLLLSSRAKETGLEVSCRGEIVRLENQQGEECQIALAVKISDYRLFPLVPGHVDVAEPQVPAAGETD